jgi:hypothetical protein
MDVSGRRRQACVLLVLSGLKEKRHRHRILNIRLQRGRTSERCGLQKLTVLGENEQFDLVP